MLERWKLDKNTKKAEGLVLHGSTPMVASDRREGEPNLHWLEPLG
jgi:hypothetical protein